MSQFLCISFVTFVQLFFIIFSHYTRLKNFQSFNCDSSGWLISKQRQKLKSFAFFKQSKRSYSDDDHKHPWQLHQCANYGQKVPKKLDKKIFFHSRIKWYTKAIRVHWWRLPPNNQNIIFQIGDGSGKLGLSHWIIECPVVIVVCFDRFTLWRLTAVWEYKKSQNKCKKFQSFKKSDLLLLEMSILSVCLYCFCIKNVCFSCFSSKNCAFI